MQDLSLVLIKAKEKKCYHNFFEFQGIVKEIMLADEDIKLEWDNGAGEEWARFTKSDLGVVCMMNIKIGIVFARQKNLNKKVHDILNSLFVVDVSDYNSEEWFIDLAILEDKIPEISWHVSPNAINTKKMSLNDLYFATV